MNQHGLGGLMAAGALCRQAELLYPGEFRMVSMRGNVLHVEVPEVKLLAFKQIQGKLQQELNAFAAPRRLPAVLRFKLTICE